jgi:hypothetical protein
VSEPIHVISLGAGVQSSTMALMAAKGEIGPMPVAAVFADTQAEPAGVYKWLDWLEAQLPYPVVRATAGNLGEASTRLRTAKTSGNTYLRHMVPAYVIDEDGKKGILPRHCTVDFKVSVVRRETRRLMKQHGTKKCVQWIGISIDEAHRMKPSRVASVESIWPLIDARVSRQGCKDWMKANGYPDPPRSSCSFCPYHSDAEWRRLKAEEPLAFDEAVAYEATLSERVAKASALNVQAAFLHNSRQPLGTVDFTEDTSQLSMFGNECEGMCGV